MVLSKELRPVQSKKLYEEKSKEMLKNVSLGAGDRFYYVQLINQEQSFIVVRHNNLCAKLRFSGKQL